MLEVVGNGSPKQLAWIGRMIETKAWEEAGPASYVARVREIAEGAPVKSARHLIDFLKPLPFKGRGAGNSDPVKEAGMYKSGGQIYKVQAARESGNLYAKRLIPGDPGEKASFEYAKGAIGRLKASDRLSMEDAKEFGALYGSCCVCGRLLTNEVSIEAGIGPICGGRL
jgi:hypothetical protein